VGALLDCIRTGRFDLHYFFLQMNSNYINISWQVHLLLGLNG